MGPNECPQVGRLATRRTRLVLQSCPRLGSLWTSDWGPCWLPLDPASLLDRSCFNVTWLDGEFCANQGRLVSERLPLSHANRTMIHRTFEKAPLARPDVAAPGRIRTLPRGALSCG
jgi:hypothetical protein